MLQDSSVDLDHPPWPRHAVRLAWGLVIAGIGLRLIRYLANRSLWLDEAYLTESILTYSFRQLATEPLLHWQAAPIGFLVLEKSAVALLGTSEYALRLLPLMAGVCAVPMFHAIARRCLPAAGGLAALAMFVALEPLVYYSGEVKQYSTDVAVALAIVLLTLRAIELRLRVRQLVGLGVVGTVGVFLSHPAVFVLVAAGVVLAVQSVRNRQIRSAVAVSAVGCAWAVAFVLNYVYFLRPLTRHADLNAYWAIGYAPWNWSAVPWLGRSLHAIYTDYGTMWLPLPDVAVLATALGVIWLWRQQPRVLALLALPIVLALCAAGLHRFPFGGRLILFLVPSVILLIGAGTQALMDAVLPGRRLVPTVVLLALLGPTIGRGLFYAAIPPGREEMKTLLACVGRHKQAGDALYIFTLSQVPFRYYRDRFGLGPDRFGIAQLSWIPGARVEPSEAAYDKEFTQLRGQERVWIVLTHLAALGGPDETPLISAALDRLGQRREELVVKGGRVILFEPGLRDGPAQTFKPPDDSVTTSPP